MDGKGRYADNILVERLWRTVKYEEVFLKAYANAREVRREFRKIAKSFHTIEYASNRSFPRTRESTVPSLESRCLKAGRRQSNNFAIVLGGSWELTSGSTTTRGLIRPWATGRRPRCSAKPLMFRGMRRRQGKVHRDRCWYRWQEQRDSRLIPHQSCPTNRIHLISGGFPLGFPDSNHHARA